MSGGNNIKPDPNGNLFDRMRSGGLLGNQKPNSTTTGTAAQPTLLKTILNKAPKPLGLGG